MVHYISVYCLTSFPTYCTRCNGGIFGPSRPAYPPVFRRLHMPTSRTHIETRWQKEMWDLPAGIHSARLRLNGTFEWTHTRKNKSLMPFQYFPLIKNRCSHKQDIWLHSYYNQARPFQSDIPPVKPDECLNALATNTLSTLQDLM